MPLLRILFVLVPVARRILSNPAVRARLGLSPKTPVRKGRRPGSGGRAR